MALSSRVSLMIDRKPKVKRSGRKRFRLHRDHPMETHAIQP